MQTLRVGKHLIDYVFPVGWIDCNESAHLRFLLKLMMLPDVNDQTLRADRAHHLFDGYMSNPLLMPWNILSSTASQPFFYIPRNFAVDQTIANESVIACLLERYRLANGRYPDSLNKLAPPSGTNLPHDVTDGQPYHFLLKPNGSYLLYSIGWNEKDDGGLVVLDKDDPQHHRIDYDQGYWVWFGPK